MNALGYYMMLLAASHRLVNRKARPLELKTYDIGITVVLRVTINNPSSVMLIRPVRD